MNKVKKWIFNKTTLLFDAVLVLLATIVSLLFILNQQAIIFQINGFLAFAKSSDLQVYFLDVGQANSSLMIFPGGVTMLIDTGSTDSSGKLLEQLSWILKQNNLKDIDILLLTHSDEDHVGGTKAVLDKYQTFTIYRPKQLSSFETEIYKDYDYNIVYTSAYQTAMRAVSSEPYCEVKFVEDQTFSVGQCFVTIYSCQKDKASDTNYYSPYIRVDYAGKNFLFTGDATAAREKEFLVSFGEDSFKVDFLQVAHHGSKYSSTQDFLQAVCPTYAFISAGDNAHPSQEVLSRLKNVEVKEIHITKNSGTLAVGVSKDGSSKVVGCFVLLDFPLLVVMLFCIAFMIIQLHTQHKFHRRKVVKFLKKQN